MNRQAELRAQKKTLRHSILQARRAMKAAERQNESGRIIEHISAWPVFQQAAVIFTYLAMADEPSTLELCELALARGQQVAVPLITDAKGGIMECARLHSLEQLERGSFDILAPRPPYQLIAPEQVELVIVPGAAFTLSGGRLGLGAGFYDRMLARMKNACLAAPSFECQLVAEVPLEPHDRCLDYIITKEGIFRCQA